MSCLRAGKPRATLCHSRSLERASNLHLSSAAASGRRELNLKGIVDPPKKEKSVIIWTPDLYGFVCSAEHYRMLGTCIFVPYSETERLLRWLILSNISVFVVFLEWKNMRVNKWYSQHLLKWKFTLEIMTDIATVPLSSAFPFFFILNEYTNCQMHHCGLQPNSLQHNFNYSNKDIVVFRELKFEKTMIVGWRTTWIETACQHNKLETGKACGYQVWDNGPKRAETHYWSLSNIGYLSFTRPGNLTVHWFQEQSLWRSMVLNLSIQFMS